MSPQSLPIACDLTALTDAQRERHLQAARQVFDLKQSLHELADGYAWQFADNPDLYLLIAEFMSLEHRCCPFFHLTLEAEPGQNTIWLRVTGADGIKAFIQAEMLA